MQIAPEILAVEAAASSADVSLAAILARAEVNPTTWWRWVRGHADPRLTTIRRVRAALDAILEERGQRGTDGGDFHAATLTPATDERTRKEPEGFR